VLLIALIVLVLGLGVFALNYFNVIHLWGKKPAVMTEAAIPEPTIPEPEVTPPDQQQPQQEPVTSPEVAPPPTTAPAPKASAPPKVSLPPSGSGEYTVQVSSWASSQKAEVEAARLTSAGYTAFVEDGVVAGRTWYRVRVGRYGTEREAAEAVRALQPGMESDIWVARVGR
jgi:cell division protein FtsN